VEWNEVRLLLMWPSVVEAVSGEVLSIGQDPRVSKPNQLHATFSQFFFIKLGHALSILLKGSVGIPPEVLNSNYTK
jgi:hypothetical protein